MTAEELEALIADIEWEQFQEPYDGNIYFWHNGKIRFSYRIGLQFKRPMEAIMAQAQFIRMRAAPQYDWYELKRLDPDNVDKCLYPLRETPGLLPHTLLDKNAKDWVPKLQKGWEQVPFGQPQVPVPNPPYAQHTWTTNNTGIGLLPNLTLGRNW